MSAGKMEKQKSPAGNHLTKQLLAILKEIRPEHDFTTPDDFISSGLLDSFDIITLVSKLEEHLNIDIDGEDINHENFKNLETLEKFVRRLVRKNGS
jgi:acyl carrier protein